MATRARAESKQGSGRRRTFVPVEETGRPLPIQLREVLAFAVLALGLFLTIAALSYHEGDLDPVLGGADGGNWGGVVGHHLGGVFLAVFGISSFLFFAFLIFWGLLLFLHRELPRAGMRVLGALILTLVLSMFLAGPSATPRGTGPGLPVGLGGALGSYLGPRLFTSFGGFGAHLLLAMTGLMAFLVATDWGFGILVADLKRAFAGVPAEAEAEAEVEDRSRTRRKASPDEGREGRRGGLLPLLRRSLTGLAEWRRQRVASKEAAAAARAEAGGDLAVAEPEEDSDSAELGAKDTAPRRSRLRRRRREAEQPVAGQLQEDGNQDLDQDADQDQDVDLDVDGRAASVEDEEAAELGSTPSSEQAPPEHPAEPRSATGRPQPKPSTGARPITITGEHKAPPARPRRRKSWGDFVLPPLDLLEIEPQLSPVADRKSLERAADAIERRLSSHRIDAKVVEISAGPAITLFELEVGEGQRLAALRNFAPDLSAALKALSVRIVAPIPGKHTVGVEVPNAKRSLVYLRELIETYRGTTDSVPLFLGRNVSGKPIVADLARMPHLLIAGATGSGKSVCINSILLSILMSRSPAQVRLILIDPKMVELQNYARIPHLLCPVVSNMKRAPAVLSWAVEQMEQRYALLSSAGVRKLDDYNSLGEEKLRRRLGPAYDPERTPANMPSIVLVIDEFADLMTVAASEVEVSIQRLAQKSRAVGIHVILATQRPSRDVITGLIKANLPTRISFQVANKVDSRVILDANGAEQLLGHGDMLWVPPGTSQLVRAQGAYVSDEEIHAVVEFLEQRSGGQDFESSLVQNPSGSGRGASDRDELFEDACRIILEEQRGSATLLQRKLAVGYTRATRLIELMEEDGVVGPFQGSKSREILLTLEEWEAGRVAVADQDASDPTAEASVVGPAVADSAVADPRPGSMEDEALAAGVVEGLHAAEQDGLEDPPFDLEPEAVRADPAGAADATPEAGSEVATPGDGPYVIRLDKDRSRPVGAADQADETSDDADESEETDEVDNEARPPRREPEFEDEDEAVGDLALALSEAEDVDEEGEGSEEAEEGDETDDDEEEYEDEAEYEDEEEYEEDEEDEEDEDWEEEDEEDEEEADEDEYDSEEDEEEYEEDPEDADDEESEEER